MISLILHGFGLGNINIILWQQTLSPFLWMLAVRSTGFLPTPYAHLYVFSIYCRIFKRQTWWLRLSLRILTSNTRSSRKLNRSGQFFVVYPILCSHILIVYDCNQLVFSEIWWGVFFFMSVGHPWTLCVCIKYISSTYTSGQSCSQYIKLTFWCWNSTFQRHGLCVLPVANPYWGYI